MSARFPKWCHSCAVHEFSNITADLATAAPGDARTQVRPASPSSVSGSLFISHPPLSPTRLDETPARPKRKIKLWNNYAMLSVALLCRLTDMDSASVVSPLLNLAKMCFCTIYSARYFFVHLFMVEVNNIVSNICNVLSVTQLFFSGFGAGCRWD
jgi:hypothetical protein